MYQTASQPFEEAYNLFGNKAKLLAIVMQCPEYSNREI
jgi:hypothetical protein